MTNIQSGKGVEIDEKYKWNNKYIYVNQEAWEKDFASLNELVKPLIDLKNHFSEGPDVVLKVFKIEDEINRVEQKLFTQANINFLQDTRNPIYQGIKSRIVEKSSEISALSSFVRPELLSLSDEKLKEYRLYEEMKDWLRIFDEIVRYKPYTLSIKEEQLLSSAGPSLRASSNTFELLNNADLVFPDIKNEKGELVKLTHGNFIKFLMSFDRDVRKSAFETIYKTYIGLKNTFCSTLDGQVKVEIFKSHARGYKSCLEYSLFDDNIDLSVYNSLIEAVHQSLPIFYKYLSVRQRTLKLAELDMYDLYVPLVSTSMEIPYDTAVTWVLEALSPLGEEYVNAARKGLLEDRWADVYETEGKRSGALSVINYDGLPYLLLNYNSTLNDVFTIAHELGHSMHTYFSTKTQPFRYFHYSLFVGEVASTTNEALLFYYLLNKARAEKNKEFELYLINHRCDDFKGSIIRQTQFAEFEQEIHAMAERGEPLTPESLSSLYKKINDLYYGDVTSPSSTTFPHRLRASPYIPWEFMRVPHFYYSFYVYKYSTSISASDVIAEKIYNGDKKQLDDYFTLLRAGCSKDPLDILQDTGVNLRTPEPVIDAMKHFKVWVDELDKLLQQ